MALRKYSFKRSFSLIQYIISGGDDPLHEDVVVCNLDVFGYIDIIKMSAFGGKRNILWDKAVSFGGKWYCIMET